MAEDNRQLAEKMFQNMKNMPGMLGNRDKIKEELKEELREELKEELKKEILAEMESK